MNPIRCSVRPMAHMKQQPSVALLAAVCVEPTSTLVAERPHDEKHQKNGTYVAFIHASAVFF